MPRKTQQCSKWGYQENFKPVFFFFFFYEKIFFLKNYQNPKKKIYTLLDVFCTRRKPLPLLFFVRLFLFCYLVFAWFIFARSKCFRNKSKLAWNYPNNLIYYTTGVYPYQPAYRKFICTHLFLFAIIWRISSFYQNLFYLWESLLVVRIFLNLFHLCESMPLWK